MLPFLLLALVTLAGYVFLANLASHPPAAIPLRLLLLLLPLLVIPALVLAHWLPRLPRKQAPLWAMVGVAVVVRLFFFAVDPYLSDDVYRYLWDGRVQAAGMQPYGVRPDDSSLDGVEQQWPEDERVRALVNLSSISTHLAPSILSLMVVGSAPGATRKSYSNCWCSSA